MPCFFFQIVPCIQIKSGTLTNLDTPNPILYMEFPNVLLNCIVLLQFCGSSSERELNNILNLMQGRLKLNGTIVYSQNKVINTNFNWSFISLCVQDFNSIGFYPPLSIL